MANRFVLNTISYHGSGAIKEIPGELQRRGYKKIFVCSDPDLVKFGVTAKVTDELDAAGIAWSLYSEIKPNPTIQNVKDGVEAFKAAEADAIVTIGGGSSMDTAKAIGIIINNPEFADVRSLEGVAPTKNHAVFTIAVPTTAGTAAEVTINYVITDPEKVRKFVCVDTNDAPEVAVVDPDMMASMPAGLTASTGMDALTHAIEGYTTKGAWELSDMFHFEAIKLISENLRDSVAEAKSGQPGSGREGMALGQYVAGMGFSNVGLGIDHAMAHTLSAHYDTPHGVACAMLLPIAMEFNKPVCAERLAKVAVAMGVDTTGMSTDEAADAAIAAVSASALAIGILVISRTTGMTTDVDNYMFGSVLAMTKGDVALSVILSVTVLALYLLFYHQIFAVTFDESFSRATGLKVDACNTLLAILTALTIVLGMRMMGAMLVSSLVIFPALTAMRLFKSFRGVILCAAVTSVVCFCVGLTISFGFSTPVGATVVAADLTVFLAACLLAALRRK